MTERQFRFLGHIIQKALLQSALVIGSVKREAGKKTVVRITLGAN